MSKPLDEHACADLIAKVRWPDGWACTCGHPKFYRITRRPRVRECTSCGRQHSVTAGTALHGCRLLLSTWLRVIDIFHGGIAALRLAELIGVSYETAFQAAHRIRIALLPKAPTAPPLGTPGVSWGVRAHETRPPWLTKPRHKVAIVGYHVDDEFVAYGLLWDPLASRHIRNRRGTEAAIEHVCALNDELKARHGAVSRRWIRAYLAEHSVRATPEALLSALVRHKNYAFARVPAEPGQEFVPQLR